MQKQQDDILSALRYGEELTWLLDEFVKEQRERFAEWLEDYRGDHTRDDRGTRKAPADDTGLPYRLL